HMHFLKVSCVYFPASCHITGYGNTTAAYGRDAHYRCTVANPAGVLQVTWQRLFKDESIENLATYSKRFGAQVNEPYKEKVIFEEATLSSTSIILKNVTWEDDSCYICSFNVYPDGSKRKQTCLTVQGISEVNTGVHAPSSQDDIKEVVFSCSATGKPAPTIHWSYPPDTSSLDQTQTTTITNSDHTFTSSSNITLQVPQGWSGHVDCHLNRGVTGEKLEKIPYSSEPGHEGDMNGQAAVVQTQQTVTAAVGDEACLSCQLTLHKEVLQVTWWKLSPEGEKNVATSTKYFGLRVNPDFRDKVKFKDAGLQNNSIVIRNVTEQDESCYQCLFNSNPEGALTATTCLKVYELHEPVLHVESNSAEEAVVSCSATGRPAPTVTLRVLQQDLHLSNYSSVNVTNTNSTVTVTCTAVLSGSRDDSTQVGCAVRVLSGPQKEVFMMIPEVKQSSADGFDEKSGSNNRDHRWAVISVSLLLVVVCGFLTLVFFRRKRENPNRVSEGACRGDAAGSAVKEPSDMSDKYSEILRESAHKGNYIPSGRQLHRTPPLPDVKRHLDDSSLDLEQQQQHNVERQAEDYNRLNSTFDFNTPGTKPEPDDLNSMLKGMKGYQLIPSDLEFIKKMEEEKLIKSLQRDLEEVQRLLKKEAMAAELARASRDKAQAELKKFRSCEELTEWVKVVLGATSPSVDLTDMDAKSLLAMVTKESVQRVTDEKRLELRRMEKTLANKRKKEAKEREQLEKQITVEQLKIPGLRSQLTDLKSELAREEASEAPEIRVEADKVEKLPAAKGQARRRGKERKQDVKPAEKLQDAKKQNKSKTDSRSSVGDDRGSKNTSEPLKTKQKSGAAAEKQTKSVRAAGEPQRRKTEETDSNLQESEGAVKGRRKPPGSTQAAASQAKNQSKVKTGEAPSRGGQRAADVCRQLHRTPPLPDVKRHLDDSSLDLEQQQQHNVERQAEDYNRLTIVIVKVKTGEAPSRGGQRAADGAGEEAQHAGPRRSKRIASRR
ncbi:OX-2 membrane glycoprotein, partial [Nibea albiflora]